MPQIAVVDEEAQGSLWNGEWWLVVVDGLGDKAYGYLEEAPRQVQRFLFRGHIPLRVNMAQWLDALGGHVYHFVRLDLGRWK